MSIFTCGGNASSGGGGGGLRSDELLSWEDGVEKQSFRILDKNWFGHRKAHPLSRKKQKD